jgi:hypothetical protein
MRSYTGIGEQMKTRLTWVSFGLAMAGAALLLILPVYSGFDGNRVTHATLLEMNGTWAIFPVMLPVLIAATPLLFRKQAVRIIAMVLLCGFVLIAMSIGLFYLPAAIMMALAACVGDSAKFRDAWP